MTNTLTKTAKVLQNEPLFNTAAHFAYFQRDDEFGPVLNVLKLNRQDAIDLGSPREITVTVEPGNTLETEVAEEPQDSTGYLEGEYYDEETLNKVYAVLMHNGYTPDEAIGVVSDFQNAGLLFRERR